MSGKGASRGMSEYWKQVWGDCLVYLRELPVVIFMFVVAIIISLPLFLLAEKFLWR